jgi:hypothetical protein
VNGAKPLKLLSNKLGIGLLLLGVVLLFLGVYRGEVAIIFEKAIRICLGCIGIG